MFGSLMRVDLGCPNTLTGPVREGYCAAQERDCGHESVASELRAAPNAHRIQFEVALHPSINPLDRSAISIELLPVLYGLLPHNRLLVRRVGIDDGRGPVLALDRSLKLLTGVSGVAKDVIGHERVSKSRLPQQGCSHLHIGDVAGGDIDCDWQFVNRIDKKVRLVAKCVLVLAVRVSLDAPASVGVAHLADLRSLASDGASPWLALLVGVAPALMCVLSIATDLPNPGSVSKSI